MPLAEPPGTLHKRIIKLMGNRFEITVLHADPQHAIFCIDEAITEISRIENLLTTFNESSQVNLVNQNAGVSPVKVDKEVLELIKRSIKISEITQGAFDITYGSLDKQFWNFDQNMTELPDQATAKQLVRLINYRNIQIDECNSTLFLKEKGMRIGFGGIGKGYAAEKAKKLLKGLGIQSGIVNAAGDLCAWGNAPGGGNWTIGIADPAASHHPFSTLDLTDKAVATSGNYEKFVIIKGKKYSHTIDPKTGYPVSGIKSVTIISPSAEIADAFATPVMVMGVETGLHMVNQLPLVSCIIIDDHNKLFTSQNIKLII